MRKLKTSFFLVCALGGLLAASSVQAQDGTDGSDGGLSGRAAGSSGVSVPAADLSPAASRTAQMGGWFWGLLADPVLSGGATAVTSDPAVPTTLYVGGPGYIAVSTDSGANWSEKVRFAGSAQDDDEDNEGTPALGSISGDNRVELMREYLRQELEEQFGIDYANDLIEEITEDELLQAGDVSEIDALKDLTLDMDSDLTHVVQDAVVAGVNASVFESFASRYQKYLNAGAESDTAVEYAAHTPSVLSFSRTSSAVYAVTASVIYMTTDHGENWSQFMQLNDEAMLSFDISQDGNLLMIGMSDGLMLTRNAGAEWVQLTDVFNGAVFECHISAGAGRPALTVLSTDGIYQSTDVGLTWRKLELPGRPGEFVRSVVPGEGRRMLALTDSQLYMTQDGVKWQVVAQGPFPDEPIEQVVAKDATLNAFLVRTASRVFEYDPSGWVSQNKSLMASDLGAMAYMHDGVSLALMASSAGIWMAQDARLIEVTGEYKTLLDVWQSEPSDQDVIDQALEAHYVGSILEKGWGMRSRLSWLLPQVTFDYNYRQTLTDLPKLTYTLSSAPDLDLGLLNYKYVEDYTYKFENRTEWQILARWNLNIEQGLKDEIASKRIMMRLRNERLAIIKQVMADLKKRRALQVAVIIDMPRMTGKSKGAIRKAVRTYLGLAEVEARLHYMTGGYYIPAVHQNDKKI